MGLFSFSLYQQHTAIFISGIWVSLFASEECEVSAHDNANYVDSFYVINFFFFPSMCVIRNWNILELKYNGISVKYIFTILFVILWIFLNSVSWNLPSRFFPTNVYISCNFFSFCHQYMSVYTGV